MIGTRGRKAAQVRSCHTTLTPLSGLFLEALKGEVILADVFQDVPIGPQPEAHQRRPGIHVTLGVVKGEVDLQRLVVHATQSNTPAM